MPIIKLTNNVLVSPDSLQIVRDVNNLIATVTSGTGASSSVRTLTTNCWVQTSSTTMHIFLHNGTNPNNYFATYRGYGESYIIKSGVGVSCNATASNNQGQLTIYGLK